MTERNPALWIQARTDHTAENDRALMHALFAGREGIIQPSHLAVSQRGAGANMSVDVAAGVASVLGDDNANQGTYLVWNDATANLAIAAADATNPRKDIVIARVRDAFYSGATNAFDLAVVTGTPAGSPSEPALPNNSLKLATVDVAALATSIVNANITDRRPRASALGGRINCTSTTRPTSPLWEGMVIYETDTNKEFTYDGAAWWCTGITGAGATNYTPTVDQGGSNNVAKTVSYSQYRIIDGVCEWWFRLDITGTSTSAGFPVTLTTPVTMATTVAGLALGGGIIFDTSATTADSGQWEYRSTTTIMLFTSESTNDGWGATPSIAIVSGDQIRGHVRFLVAAAA